MKAIINAKLVMPDHIIPDGVLVIDGDRIVDFGMAMRMNTDGMEIIDAEGAYVGPGFIEIHTHAINGTLIYEDPIKGAREMLRHGVTDGLAALYFSQTADELIEQLGIIGDAMKSGKAPNLMGTYMEAPYMNPKFGADRTNNPWVGPIEREKYMPVITAGRDVAKVWALAPEREGIEGFVTDVLTLNPRAKFTVGHSEATPGEVEKLIPYGLCIATHHTNATGTLNKYPECRGVCVDEAAWYNDDIYTELICDRMGIHVDPYMIRLVRKIKGDDRIILISDAFIGKGPIPPGYEGCSDINFDLMGEIAGTNLTMEAACRNMMNNGGASIPNCFKYASLNPAKALGLYDRGAIGRGKLANLVFVDGDFNIKSVLFKGSIQEF